MNGQSYADTLVVPPPPDEPYVRVIPLGGCGEIGRNMTLFETKDDIVAVDCGLMFPDEEMYGVDIVINDFSYLRDRRDKLRALLVTHGHEDHIGGIPYFLREFPKCPIVGTPLTLALIKAKLKEHKPSDLDLVKVEPGDKVRLRRVQRRVHPHQPLARGRVRAGDPHAAGRVLPYRRFQIRPDADRRRPGRLRGDRARRRTRRAVHALGFDQRGAARAIRSPSASSAKRSQNIFARAAGRIIVTSFASNVPRIQQVVDQAQRFNRKVAFLGRSLTNVVQYASELKYLDIPDGLVIKLQRRRVVSARADRRDDDRFARRADVGADAAIGARSQAAEHRARRYGRDQRDPDSRQREERRQDDQQPLSPRRDTSSTVRAATRTSRATPRKKSCS